MILHLIWVVYLADLISVQSDSFLLYSICPSSFSGWNFKLSSTTVVIYNLGNWILMILMIASILSIINTMKLLFHCIYTYNSSIFYNDAVFSYLQFKILSISRYILLILSVGNIYTICCLIKLNEIFLFIGFGISR